MLLLKYKSNFTLFYVLMLPIDDIRKEKESTILIFCEFNILSGVVNLFSGNGVFVNFLIYCASLMTESATRIDKFDWLHILVD